MKSAITTANLLLLAGMFMLVYQGTGDEARGRDKLGSPGTAFVRGDANDDGIIEITDPVFALNFLFLGDEEPPCLAAADANDDGVLEITDAVRVLTFLFGGGPPPSFPHPDPGQDPTPDLGCREAPFPQLPEVGAVGGPDRELTVEEEATWLRGRRLFDRMTTVADGLGPRFNGDSCRGCHLDPVIGGAGGLDVDVVRFAYVNEDGDVAQMEGGPAVSRLSIHGVLREEQPVAADVLETRQTPTIFGLGLVDRLPDSVFLERVDPDDDNGDGISGRARMVADRVGRFGHKAGVPSLANFSADALFNELGLTVAADLSTFAVPEDADAALDPELQTQDFLDMAFFVAHLAPPQRQVPDDPEALARVEQGELLFATLGCDGCHVPALHAGLDVVPAYSDFLLHEIADPERHYVNESDVEPRGVPHRSAVGIT